MKILGKNQKLTFYDNVWYRSLRNDLLDQKEKSVSDSFSNSVRSWTFEIFYVTWLNTGNLCWGDTGSET